MASSAYRGLPWRSRWGRCRRAGEPGTISTVTAPDGGDYIAAFTGYKIYPTVEEGFQGVDGPVDLVAAPEYRSHYPWYLAAGPQGRVHISDGTIIYRRWKADDPMHAEGLDWSGIRHSVIDADYLAAARYDQHYGAYATLPEWFLAELSARGEDDSPHQEKPTLERWADPRILEETRKHVGSA